MSFLLPVGITSYQAELPKVFSSNSIGCLSAIPTSINGRRWINICGIFGYIGKQNASEVVLAGLKRLEYRGYDSWGIAILADQIKINKKVGAIGDLNQALNLPKSSIGVGHTRWATHGGVTDINAHPHFSTDKSFCLAQNGIVENYQKLKDDLLKKGYKFQTETDTEVIVRLIEEKLKKTRDLKEAVRQAFLELSGRNTVIILTKYGRIIAARNGSPLVVGVNNKEIFFSSDTLSFAPFADKIVVIDNGQMVYYNGKLNVIDIKSGKSLPYRLEKIDFHSSKVDKEGYDHFMLKEIHESPYVINQIVNRAESQFENFIKAVKQAKNVYTIGSGTAGVAASQIAFYLRVFAKIKAQSVIGADIFEYYDLLSKDDLIIAPSQSGETADVLEVLEIAKKRKVKIASLVNMPGSTMTRMSDFRFMSFAGPEICVMSTKVFTSQIAWGYLLGKVISGKGKVGRENLKILSQEMERYLDAQSNHELIKKLAKRLGKSKDIFLLGKYQNFNIIKEGMIKIIEGSYIHAHGIPAGDLKHYAITLMEKGVPVVVVVSEDVAKGDVLNAVNQVKARGATVIGISSTSHPSFDHYIPVPNTGETQAIMNIIPLQLLAYYMAVELGHNVDKPRNIAKSVTVKYYN
ncbi:glutamine--fructose-6-phosphate transaminase (isomerizing) [Candidatus Daviesbacteria bacterium]|nr:glutamine--fructose-6-phosphate transaminase (isomerizing) [Candidatus Daviesbacteria bacterium]